MSSIILIFLFLAGLVGIILGVTVFARWVRTKLIWTTAGRELVDMGLPKANGTIGDMQRGQRYRVTKSFVDYFGGSFEAGEILTYIGQEYVDHVGNVLHFHERTLGLNEYANREILARIWAFLEPVRP
jgi:hypothetical protein